LPARNNTTVTVVKGSAAPTSDFGQEEPVGALYADDLGDQSAVRCRFSVAPIDLIRDEKGPRAGSVGAGS
jgi:hypothetical protein